MTKFEKQLAGAGKRLGSTLDQLDLDKRLSAVEKTLGGVAGKVGLAERKTVLGIPVGRKRPEWGKIAGYGAAAIGVLAGARALKSNGEDPDPDAEEAAEEPHTADARADGDDPAEDDT